MILIINTVAIGHLEIIIAKNNADFNVKKLSGELKPAEQLLPVIEETLSTMGKQISDINGLGVINGPAGLTTAKPGFTALRIGVVIANALAYALKVPVVDLALDEFSNHQDLIDKVLIKLKSVKAESIVIPQYGREPNINKVRK
ncbi:MAG: hypothetical protein A3B89_00775 [Candidatus Buchananbacteria bacterium RIFCSPHIGHO2_02_FULL_40_13]|uniref:Gcp-like domain-containing protein n=1 Tax=Candidatus Buchananbacteria bacterium RIFCSPLOWO2_01_FULL_39_33 TaxID=1797543 RepID=A0A1G1YJ92_9BACT|nr:MAG: hypothetical protein A2820_00840 [Candidatus Buchananbacteria bacterium RIFCSPHIGHO2_01_FULL_40_35]OGY50407.1 MAG: hypothetical protein A3B89_00775 [Candidatus Buchananbacteria bacterium RIFCSPHIGHO2_02_FULL_40_13]OGY51547.1 MAG: hypothetical protein A3A02_01930 [Candidatus Buchananbacteria bacterium RIFCSPLOWO2_01_FULL_39_33]